MSGSMPQPGVEPWSLGIRASMIPLDHRLHRFPCVFVLSHTNPFHTESQLFEYFRGVVEVGIAHY